MDIQLELGDANIERGEAASSIARAAERIDSLALTPLAIEEETETAEKACHRSTGVHTALTLT